MVEVVQVLVPLADFPCKHLDNLEQKRGFFPIEAPCKCVAHHCVACAPAQHYELVQDQSAVVEVGEVVGEAVHSVGRGEDGADFFEANHVLE